VKAQSTTRNRRPEAGIALLISIFILLLISVVAIALIVASGTESSLAGNYRSATEVYYAALAGMEEARGRLSTKDANSFANTAPAGFLPAPGTPLQMGYVRYVLNPGPADGNVLTTYPDNEYLTEFTTAPSDKKTTASIWTSAPLNALNLPGPLYKWVRINAVSEQSLNLDTYPYDGRQDPTPVYYDGTNLNDTNSGSQVLEITALAVLPNGTQNSQKLLQYLVAPAPLSLNFNAALTLDGNNVQFTVPNSSNFWVRGNDQYSAGTCNPGSGVVAAVGYTNNSDSSQSHILSAIHSGPSPAPDWRSNYTNGVASTPDVSYETLSPSLQTVAGLNALVQTITQSADVVVNGNATQSSMPAGMSASNPMTIVINGDLTFNGWHGTGYGLLLVTGTFTFDPDATWNGIVLVIGAGKLYSHQGGNGQLNGAVFLAQTVDSSGTPLSSLGTPNFDFTSSSGSNGIYYSSCWVKAAQPAGSFKILSFHEIPE
jgi:hypothetical protein